VFNGSSLARLALVHPALQARIRTLDALAPSLSIQVTQGLRTFAEQDAIYAQGRTAPGEIVSNVKGGYSAHNFGYAVDLVPEDVVPGQPDWNIEHPAWQTMLRVAPACGLAEGAQWRTFKDNPHFYLKELPADPNDTMRMLYSEESGLANLWRIWNISNAPKAEA
jgi:peptidoglycan LD-endopeptidase CwlK